MKVIRLHAEDAHVEVKKVETAIVRLSTSTSSREERVQTELAREDVSVERVQVGTLLERAPEVRLEGDVTVFPIVEEVLVVEKRYLLKEEVRVTRVKTTSPHVQTIRLRSQEMVMLREVRTPTQQVSPPNMQHINETKTQKEDTT